MDVMDVIANIAVFFGFLTLISCSLVFAWQKGFKKDNYERMVNKLVKKTNKETKIIAKEWKMRKFVIVNKKVREEFPDIYNGALNTETRRIYINKIPVTTVKFLFNELFKMSEYVDTISVEFDQYKGGYNIEFEIYLRQNGSDNIISFLDIQNSPCSVDVSKRFYFELISQLERNIT